ncbi:endo-alpha-N-acetylgalactosaminidase family protein [Clostridium tarantellae]|uniref:WW domain-containing protein n=1 Tax=Clostridium tarantellae TaxID=39493 RepID=A0A6I1MJ46_9CLOT|nr:endo-alpha-N-acetylgalactosaminidase family protein [Clostridium tarantellae]MPQ43130.1 hypothetical protein [Clostridium tarantellae]
MQIKQDKYNVAQSKIVNIVGRGSDIRLDMQLDFNNKQTNIGSSLTGKVVDSNNNAIKGAVIKLVDGNFQPLTNTMTDDNGNYFINSLPFSNIYKIIATAIGKIVFQTEPFTLLLGENKTINITLQLDTNTSLGSISGNLKGINGQYIQGAIILLYNLVNGAENLMAITYTDSSGVCVLSELDAGNYKIILNALGYLSEQITVSVKSGIITTFSKVLNENPQAADGIVSGIITDTSNSVVANADVILYNVDKDNSLTPVAFTSTNSAGIYTFINVPAGNYLVKSNQSELVTVADNDIPTTSITSTKNSLENNKFTFQGYNWLSINTIEFDIINKKLIVKSTGTQANEYVDNKLYFSLLLYDGNGNLKASASLTGDDNGNNFASILNGVSFEYGYYFKIYHMEPWRVLISGNVAHAPTDLSLGFNNIDLNIVKLYIESNGLQYVTLSKLYHIDFSTAQNSGNWQSKSGTANITLENNILNIKTVESIIIDDNAPMLDKGVYEATFKYTSNDENHGRIGLVFRYVDNNNWAAICYDLNRWVWRTATGFGDFGANLPILQVGKEYKIRLQYNDKIIILIISGKDLPDGAITMRQYIQEIPIASGKVGFMNWYVDKNIQVKEICLNKIPMQNNLLYIQSNSMKVTLDSKYPRIIEYKWNSDGLILDGERDGVYVVEINGDLYMPEISYNQIDNKTILYTITFNTIQVVITMKIYLINDYTVKNEITEIRENGSFKVKRIKFPNNNVATIKSTDNGQIAATINTGAWGKITDEFLSVDNYNIGVFKRAYAFINNDKFVVTLSSNTFDAESKCILTVENRNNFKQVTLSSGLFEYRKIFDDIAYLDPLPCFEVSIGRDVNGNGVVDWQDGAILFRQNKTPIVGAEYIKDSFSYIALNTAGLAQSPFIKTADIIKRLANYTDGFGQIVLEKGYQGEGHDDVIADIDGHIGIRQGGKDDLNKLIEIASKYNAKIGLHINVTEYHLDAFQIKVENLIPGFIKAWNWVDQGYIVDKKKDFLSGEIKKKIDNLEKEFPGLKWIYVDVYEGEHWVAYKLATLLNSKGWMLGTEYSGPFEEQIGWVHWGSDPSYTNEANKSKIVRFIRNGEQDAYLADDLLKASKHVFPSGWIEKHDLEGPHVIDMIYNQNLPSKYMQHFDIMEWVDDGTNGFVKFNNGLISKRENGNINIYQDDKLIATTPISSLNWRRIGITTLFMPWPWAQIDGKPQKKVYHWNPNGGQTTWDIPNMWSGVSKVKVYKLSAEGRNYINDISVINGKITINAQAKTPYVLFPYDEIVLVNRITTWGEDSLINDPSFDSENISDNWVIKTTSGNNSHISRIKETFEGRLGNYIVRINGNNGANAIISQKINGLSEGKTYTASVWVKLEGDRRVTLGVNCNEKISESTINRKTTRIHRTGKWRGDTFTRIKVHFKVPSGITTATLYVNVANDNKDSKVYLDEFRIWTNPLNLPATNREGYVLYEDFENVDEGWGPFYSTIVYADIAGYESSARRTHFAEKSPNGGQYMCWVIDGRFSFKTNELANNTGELLVTDESTLQLKPNTKYELGFKYTCKLSNLYHIVVNSPTAGILFKAPLLPSNVVGNPEDGADYIREVKTFNSEFITKDADDYYLALEKAYGYDELILDNLYILDKDAGVEGIIAINELYYTNFENSLNSGSWKVLEGEATTTITNNQLNLNTTVSTVIDKNCPMVANGIYKATFMMDSNEGRLGFIFRYLDSNNWCAISYDINKWVWQIPEQYGDLTQGLPNLKANKKYTITIEYNNKDIIVILSGEELINGDIKVKSTIENLPVNSGQIGIISWMASKNIKIDEVALIYDPNIHFEDFNTSNTSGQWKYEIGTGTISIVDGTLNIGTTIGTLIDEKAPLVTNGIYKIDFKYSPNDSNEGRLGFVFRYVDANNWAAVCYDIDRWVCRMPQEEYAIISGLPNLQINKQYNIKIEYNNKNISITLTGEILTNPIIVITSVPQLSVNLGSEGIISWYTDKNITLDNFSVEPIKTLYYVDFNNNSGKWTLVSGEANTTIANGKLNIKTTVSMLIDEKSPIISNGVYKISFKYNNNDLNDGRIGFVFRYVDSNDWAAICYDIDRWVCRFPKEKYTVIGSNLPNLQMNKQYTITIQYNDKKIKTILSGEALPNGEIVSNDYISEVTMNAGKVGLINWYVDKDVELDYIFLQDI